MEQNTKKIIENLNTCATLDEINVIVLAEYLRIKSLLINGNISFTNDAIENVARGQQINSRQLESLIKEYEVEKPLTLTSIGWSYLIISPY